MAGVASGNGRGSNLAIGYGLPHEIVFGHITNLHHFPGEIPGDMNILNRVQGLMFPQWRELRTDWI